MFQSKFVIIIYSNNCISTELVQFITNPDALFRVIATCGPLSADIEIYSEKRKISGSRCFDEPMCIFWDY